MAGSGSRGGSHRLLIATALLIASCGAPAFAVPLPPLRPALSTASAVPLPPRRPEEDGPPMPPIPAPQATATPPLPPETPPDETRVLDSPPAPPEPDATCPGLLSGRTVVATAVPPIADGDGCGIAAPVRVEAIVLRDGRRVPLVPAATMRCDLAASLADWLRDDVVPATGSEGDLVGVADAAAYTCRNRNHLSGERLSEHARGNAIDILALRFARRTIWIADATTRAFWAALKPSACLRFATVLGPGSDAFHATDLHLDLERRRSGAHLCQWNES